MSNKIIGIDLGTTNSCVCVIEAGEPKIIENLNGGRTTPSVVAFKNGEIQVGELAKRQAIINDNYVHSIKRQMGNNYKVDVNGKFYTPQEISAMILSELKRSAETYLRTEVTKAVITVPAYFNEIQRQATKDAAKIAGLEVMRIINEPSSAALAYGFIKKNLEETLLVYDLGGGTLDVSILKLSGGNFQVLSTSGDNYLGGDDFDDVIVRYLIKEFKKDNKIDLSTDKNAMQRLKEAAEKAKKELSFTTSAEINLPFICTVFDKPMHLNMTITRSQFEELSTELIHRCITPIRRALQEAKLNYNDINEVLLVGGSTRMPVIYDLVKQELQKEPIKSINPDEVVAMGAAVQAGIISGELKNILLLDVTPLSLGIETEGGCFSVIIPKNSQVPCSKTELITTAKDYQPSVHLNVLQGERTMAADNKLLGKFELTDIEPALRGVPKISVTFTIDVNGILSVTAKNLKTKKENQIEIRSAEVLTEEEIKRMIEEASKNFEKDKYKREETDLINNLNSLIYTSRKLIENSKNLEPLKKDELVRLTAELQTAVDKKEYDGISEKIDRVNDIIDEVNLKSKVFNFSELKNKFRKKV